MPRSTAYVKEIVSEIDIFLKLIDLNLIDEINDVNNKYIEINNLSVIRTVNRCLEVSLWL